MSTDFFTANRGSVPPGPPELDASFVERFCARFGLAPSSLTPGTTLVGGLGFDAVAMLELNMWLAAMRGEPIPLDYDTDVLTVDDLCYWYLHSDQSEFAKDSRL